MTERTSFRSMTGQGAARVERDGVRVTAEVRTINNRYYKLSARLTDGFASLEPRVDDVVRGFVRRGTVQVDVHIRSEADADHFQINEHILANYQKQLQSVYDHLAVEREVFLEPLLALPGVVEQRIPSSAEVDGYWPAIRGALEEALRQLTDMRSREGAAMAKDLAANCRRIAEELDAIERRAPFVIEGYRARLLDRLNRLLSEHDIQVAPGDVVREVGLFAERADISEEVVRLRSHLAQFQTTMESPEVSGRKLDFLSQEMFRETNTIGAKANDAEIASHVVELKTIIERIREMIQNVE